MHSEHWFGMLSHRGIRNESWNVWTVWAESKTTSIFLAVHLECDHSLSAFQREVPSLPLYPLWAIKDWLGRCPHPFPWCLCRATWLPACPLPPPWQEHALWLSSQPLCRHIPSGCWEHLAELAPFFSLGLGLRPWPGRLYNTPLACSFFPAPAVFALVELALAPLSTEPKCLIYVCWLEKELSTVKF